MPEVTAGLSEEVPNASSRVTVEQDAKKGKYIVAKENLSTSDTVLVEKAVAACLYPRNYGTNCNACFTR